MGRHRKTVAEKAFDRMETIRSANQVFDLARKVHPNHSESEVRMLLEEKEGIGSDNGKTLQKYMKGTVTAHASKRRNMLKIADRLRAEGNGTPFVPTAMAHAFIEFGHWPGSAGQPGRPVKGLSEEERNALIWRMNTPFRCNQAWEEIEYSLDENRDLLWALKTLIPAHPSDKTSEELSPIESAVKKIIEMAEATQSRQTERVVAYGETALTSQIYGERKATLFDP